MYDIITIIGAYLLGAIPFGLLIPKLFGVADIRKSGSGNTGSTNAWRVAGPAAGILVMIFDILKGVGAVLLVSFISGTTINPEILKLISGLAAVIGHIFPIYLMFKGGKGVNTALGVMLILLPFEALISIATFIVVVTVTRYISLGSMLAAMALLVTLLIRWYFSLADINPIYIIVVFLLNVLIVIAHHSNIKRLMNGNESRFSFSSKISGNTGKVRENV